MFVSLCIGGKRDWSSRSKKYCHSLLSSFHKLWMVDIQTDHVAKSVPQLASEIVLFLSNISFNFSCLTFLKANIKNCTCTAKTIIESLLFDMCEVP